MKEEQDDIIEEDLVDEGPLTYDRPDNNNKVILHRSVTGLWHMCSSDHRGDPKAKLRDHPIRRKRQKHSNCVQAVHGENVKNSFPPLQCEASSCGNLHPDLQSLPREGKRTKSSVSRNPSCSPRVPRVQSSKCVSLNQPMSTNSHGVVSTDSATKTIERSEGDSFIGSRTRRKNVSGSGSCMSLLGSNCSSSSSKPSAVIGSWDCDSTANHKYQTRQKSNNDSQ